MIMFFIGSVISNSLPGSGIGQNIDERVRLVFNIHQKQEIYDESDYGEPPQFAIWIENPENQTIRTVFVTHRTGTGEFDGKVECPISLPIWIGVFRKETERDDFPRPWKPFFDSVTGATPKVENFKMSVEVEKGIRWLYFIEMNVAGDYNKSFPSVSSDKRPDNHGNGQPSLIYKGEILSENGKTSMPEIIGRSNQYYFTTKITPDSVGIDSAKEVFTTIVVSCE